jgi:diaminopimelate epimerase
MTPGGRPAKLAFAKLHGAGNDFLVFDGAATEGLEARLPALAPALCDRRLGLGADGVLLLLPAGPARARLLYWNADGTQAAFCANGTRCAARFASEIWGFGEAVIETGFAPIPARVAGAEVTLELPRVMAEPRWRILRFADSEVRARYLVVGVPHLVVPVAWPDFWERNLKPLAPALRAHPALPEGGANVNLIAIADEEVHVRSWERGVEGETLSCGSGDVAAGLVALAEGWITGPARVRTASGRSLVVEARGDPPECASRLTGPAEWVASGEVAPELLATPPTQVRSELS